MLERRSQLVGLRSTPSPRGRLQRAERPVILVHVARRSKRWRSAEDGPQLGTEITRSAEARTPLICTAEVERRFTPAQLGAGAMHSSSACTEARRFRSSPACAWLLVAEDSAGAAWSRRSGTASPRCQGSRAEARPRLDDVTAGSGLAVPGRGLAESRRKESGLL